MTATMLYLVFALGAGCLLAGLWMISRGVGGNDGDSTIKILGVFEGHLGRMGPGALFALIGLAMVVLVVAQFDQSGAVKTPPTAASSAVAANATTTSMAAPAATNSASPATSGATPVVQSAQPSHPLTVQPVAIASADTTGPETTTASEGDASPSFPCDRAQTPAEILVCSTPALARQDNDLSIAYRAALARTNDPSAVKLSQRAWMKQRDSQQWDVRGLSQYYSDRIAALHVMASQEG
jgi:uncharacterized protein YecT (DUF1311 family)